ncbi:MAG: right-handed parallel beta-helix repeat-containing protein [ANME-2 cluster archaeon]|nr:right-handed parallel beta-helix repeat-containing protein [ANME-2 cluster archaeon]
MPDYITAKKYATLVVAASDSTATGKSTAEYVCSGVSDQVDINNAINALPAQGGKVLLLEGTYIVDAAITLLSNVILEGQGISTKIKIKDNLNAAINVITNSDQVSGNTNIEVCRLSVDGNKANNSAGTQRGVYFVKVTYSIITEIKSFDCRSMAIGLSESTNNIISNCICLTSGDEGISLYTSSNYNTVTGNIANDAVNQGIILNTSSNYNTISGNVCKNNLNDNIRVNQSNGNIIIGNVCQGGSRHGIQNVLANYNTIAGNTVQGAARYGIVIASSSHNTVNANICIENSQEIHNTYSNIIVTDNAVTYSTYNNIHGNLCRQGALANKPQFGLVVGSGSNYNIVKDNDLYDSGATANFSDAATGTGGAVIAATWHKDITLVDIGTAFVNIYPGVNGEAQQVNFTGYNKYNLIAHVNKVGTGTQSWRLEDAANSANYLQLDDAGAAGEHELSNLNVNLPSWAVGTINLIPKGSSTVAGDDPVFRRFVLMLK